MKGKTKLEIQAVIADDELSLHDKLKRVLAIYYNRGHNLEVDREFAACEIEKLSEFHDNMRFDVAMEIISHCQKAFTDLGADNMAKTVKDGYDRLKINRLRAVAKRARRKPTPGARIPARLGWDGGEILGITWANNDDNLDYFQALDVCDVISDENKW